MGDRANVVLQERGGGRLFFYTHWRGRELPLLLQRALRRRERWDDEAYLARIIFSEMTAQDPPTAHTAEGRQSSGGSLNFGISTYLGDNQYPLLVVDMRTQCIGLAAGDDPTVTQRAWTFEEFIGLPLAGDPWAAVSTGGMAAGPETGPVLVPLDMLEHLFRQTGPHRSRPRRARSRRR